ncbi:MAG: hypothetical protein HKN25_13710 [Pyrinomonadaceae bacterium]|nr:hypothetical protein [Pyrinomonadaceae bacterium]
MRNPALRLHSVCIVRSLLLLFCLLPATLISISAQKLPGSIRGYKVHNSPVVVKAANQAVRVKRNVRVIIKKFDINITEVFVLNSIWEVRNEFTVFEQSGKVDFLTFHNFKVNGFDVEIDEYKEGFTFKKGRKISLPGPIRVNMSNLNGVKAAIEELRGPQSKWRVTGKMFVFGRFKKFLFTFKRVVPVDIDLTIQNPFQN